VRFTAVANRYGQRWRHAVVAMDGNLSARERFLPDLDVSYPQIDIRKRDTLGNLRRMHAALRSLRPDLLVTGNFGAIEWALANLFAGVRHVHTEDGFGPEEAVRQLPRRVWLRRLALRRSNIVVPSQTLYRIATELWRLPKHRLHYIPNGIDLERFGAQAGCRAAGDRPLVVGTVAALRSEKNLGRLLRAFALLPADPRIRLIIVGDGPQRQELQAQAQHLGIAHRTRFTGHCAEPQHAYATFDIFALSSDTEQMPLSVVEAMAAGLPIVATDVGDVRAMVADANHDFVVPRDEASVSAALATLLADPVRRAAIGAANRERALHRYDQERMFAAYAALFDASA
jgi:glycosyltransferase involved in cell wall biosynthesis